MVIMMMMMMMMVMKVMMMMMIVLMNAKAHAKEHGIVEVTPQLIEMIKVHIEDE